MNNWKKTTLGRVCIDVFSGGTPKSTNNDYYNNGQIPWLNTKEINFNRIFSTEKNITDLGYNNSSTKWVPENSVIVAMYGATAAKVCVNKIKLTTNQACCNLVINKNIADYRYIYYNINNNYIPLSSLANGGAQQNLNSLNIKNFEINLPPLDEQKRIADVLSALDDKIEVNNKINENLEAQAQAIFKQWFVDFEFPDEEGKPYKSNGGKFIDSELGKIPEGWRVGTLGDFTTNERVRVGNNNYTVLSPVNSGELMLSEDFFNKQVYSKDISKYLIVEKDAFAYNPARINIGSIGRNKFDFIGCVSPVYVVFKTENQYQNFFEEYIKTDKFKTEVLLRAIGGVRQTLNYSDFSLITIIYPPKEIINSFNLYYNNKEEMIKHNNTEIKNLSEIRDGLLPKLMNGEVRV